jgi:hypothetical protein
MDNMWMSMVRISANSVMKKGSRTECTLKAKAFTSSKTETSMKAGGQTAASMVKAHSVMRKRKKAMMKPRSPSSEGYLKQEFALRVGFCIPTEICTKARSLRMA